MNPFPLEFAIVYEQLTAFAGLESFWASFNTAFGSEYDFAKVENLRIQWLNQDFSQLPTIQVLGSGLGLIVGAYAQSTNTIYLSQSFLATATPEQIQAVLLEEIGHYVDSLVNSVDSEGDEGEIFSALVSGVGLNKLELQTIKAQNDHFTIFVDGQSLQVEAATITVTNTNDSGAGSLRNAIASAASGDTINFSSLFNTAQTIILTSGQLVVNKSLTIQGPGANLLTISGNNASRVFVIDDNNENNAETVEISGLTISGGLVTTGSGGGIFNLENLSLRNSTLSGNSADSFGGGIFNRIGTVTVSNSTISGNSTTVFAGGGIFNDMGTVTVSNSTISGNSTRFGGGIFNDMGTVTVSNSTINGNSANLTGGGIVNNAGTTSLTTTIVANNIAGNGDGNNLLLSDGTINASNSLIESNADLINGTNSNNIFGVDPLLGSLQNNGGTTLTHALLPGSPAIGAGNTTPSTDQRGISRPQGTNGDIGAFEYVPPIVNITATDNTATEQSGNTGTFQLTRDLPTGATNTALPVQLTLSGTASASDYNFSASGGTVNASNNTVTVTFNSGSNTVNVTVTPVDDIQAEANETVILTLNGGSLNYDLGANTSGTVTISQNDFVVINTNDSGEGSLRQALLNANDISGANTITFAGVFTDATPDTITLTTGQLSITDSVTIQGPGANLLTISGNNASRIFSFGNTGPQTYNILGLTLTGGTVDRGGAIAMSDDNDILNIDRVAITGNTATAYGSGIAIAGGSTLNLTDSGIYYNNASGGGGSSVYIENSKANLSNVTVSNNTGNVFWGGSILNFSDASDRTSTVTLLNTTIANNQNYGLYNYGQSGGSPTTNYSNSIFSNNSIENFNGQAISQGNNIESGTNALLGPLQNNGGTTLTRALLPGSPAIGAGNTSLTTDQRGISRPQGTNDDIGAFEYVSPTVSLTATDNTATEAAGNTGNFQLTRVIPSGGLSDALPVQLTLSGTASASDYNFSVSPSEGTVSASSNTVTITFNAGSNTVNLTVTPVDDIQAEANETVILTLNSGTPNYDLGANTNGTVTISQNDFVVINTNDSGEGSLRQAILNANAISGANTITFAIPGGGVKTINLLSALPNITEQVTIDGTSQTGFTGTPLIELNGTSAGSGANGLTLTTGSSGSVIQGLIINRFSSGAGIFVNSSNNKIQKNYIGTNAGGTSGAGNSFGVSVNSGNNNIIGSDEDGNNDASEGNLISGNGNVGVLFFGSNNFIRGNYIGTNFDGTSAIGNGIHGIYIGSSNHNIGGSTATARNIISGNSFSGVAIFANLASNASNNIVQGNYIGTDISGNNPLGNGSGGGVRITGANNTIGGTGAGEGNIIANSAGNGVYVTDAFNASPSLNNAGNNISGNNIFNNTGLGIDLATVQGDSEVGITPNDLLDSDAGVNNLQNYPLLIKDNNGTVQGRLNSAPNTIFRIEFFSNTNVDPSGNGEGQTYLTFQNITTDGNGNASFTFTPPGGSLNITATATDPQGNTSEFSSPAIVPVVTITAIDATANEAGDPGTFRVSRTGAPIVPLTVSYAVSGTATNGSDYNSLSGTVTIPVDQTFIDIAINPIDDIQAEANETVILTLSNSVNYIQGANTNGTVTISQNDFVVTNTNDSGEGSLRQAILNANAISGGNTITFAIPGGGVKTINLLSALPNITEQVTIDGTSQTGFAGTPLIELNGASAGAVNGLTLGAGSNGSIIQGLVINRFGSGNGILVQSNNNTILGNFLGTNADGTSAQANLRGVYIDGGSNNVIGSSTIASRNLISGNTQQGIVIDKASAIGNKVKGNYIGTNLAGTAALANGFHGIQIQGGSKNNIVGIDGDGANDATEGNLISGNAQIGVITENTGTTGNIIAGNLIGTNAAGTSAISNNTGIYIANGAENTRVGTDSNGVSDSLERNIISGNTSFGIWNLNNAGNHRISGNYIGTDINGTTDLGNGSDGILVNGSANNTIGGNQVSDRNVISGNNRYGILLTSATTTGNTIQGNYIGTNASGTGAIGNSNAGIRLESGTANNLIGTNGDSVNDLAEGNVISSNSVGISIASNTTTNNTIAGNKIGTNAAGTANLGNTTQGILISDSPNNTIGGTVLNAGNLIVGNTQQGIAITGNTATGNKIQGNSLSSNGTLGVDLGADGITANDLGDGDAGPNGLQNAPRLSLAPNGIVQGQLNSTPNTTFRIEFFSNTNPDPSGYGEGQTFLNFISVTTDGSGNASFTFDPSAASNITATAIDPSGNTSEFSNVAAQTSPTFTLLTDNFTAFYNPTITNLDYNLVGRQGGLLATTRWIPNTTTAQVGNPTPNIDQGNYLLLSSSGRAALDRNFNGINAQGGLKISFELAPNATNTNSTWWGGISLGLSEANKNIFINNNVPHFGILFRGNGGIQAFDANSDVSGVNSGWGGTGNSSTLYPFSLELTDPTDGNPFNGIGQTKVEVFAGNNLIYTYTKGNGGYSDNYINLGTTGTSGFDNFKLEKLGRVPFAENATGTVYTATAIGDPLRNPSLVYSLDGPDKNLFNISQTGEISFKVAPNFEAATDAGEDNIYNLTVIASDANLTGSQNVTITVTNVNEAPINSVPDGQTTNEDTVLVFSASNSNLISISDIDAGSNLVQVALSVTNGVLTLSGTTGLSVTSGSNGSGSFTIQGTVANINGALNGLTYLGNSNFNGSDSLQIVTNDLGNTGTGGALTDTDTMTITVNAVNDAPINTLPSTFSVDEDTNLTLTGLSIADVDAGAEPVTVTLSVNSGTLAATTGGNVTVTDSGTSSIILTGTVAAINAFLAGGSAPVFSPISNFNGDVLLTLITNDQGNTGSGGAKSATDTSTITVNSVNDAPSITSGATASIAENSPVSTVIYTGTATDPDTTAPNNTVSFSLNGPDKDSFTIDSDDGEVRLKNPANFEVQNSYNIEVVVTDGGNPALSDTKAVTIQVLDVTERFTTPNRDSINTGPGNDFVTTTLDNLRQRDSINGGAGNDTLVLEGPGSTTPLEINLSNSSQVLVQPNFIGLPIPFLFFPVPWSQSSVKGFENVDASGFTGNLNLTGSNLSQTLKGGSGADRIFGLGGDDLIDGGLGADELTGGLGNDMVYLGNDSARDKVYYSAGDGTDTVFQFSRANDQILFSGIANIDVVSNGSNTEFRVGDGNIGNPGFATGSLLVSLTGVTGFDSTDASNGVISGATFSFS
ncbi:choice-of-anchor Q domain-containing protein [Synechocystis sp. LKSZ1]|uniref:choice-of-anchor Q domain-containing protein n=1 Tax=Synechocystis sp. LKSZ1 TaxID=3144951 RepID=UPI00336C2FFC